MDTISLLRDFSNAFGPSGFEDDVVAVARAHTPAGTSLREDSLRNLYIRRECDADAKGPTVMLDAHTDEVGFMVQAIRPNGLLQITALGGWVDYTVPAHRVLVRGRDGALVPGVIATKPPHFMGEAERKAPVGIESMVIDVGARSAEEVKGDFGIRIGAPVAPDTAFEFNVQNGVMMGKAFDCRAGCACVVETLRRLGDAALPAIPVGALAAQEEVGIRGARVTARTVGPDAAIVFEGCPADDSFAEPWAAQTALGKGPMLRHFDRSMITNPRFMRYALDLAEEKGIPVQEAVRTGGSTNGGSIHLAGAGIPCIVIGIPVRYIHTHYGYADISDFEAGVTLATELIRCMDDRVIASF